MPRLMYSIFQLFKKRFELRSLFHDERFSIDSVELVTAEYLQEEKIELLALDFDGVLSCHAAIQPDNSVMTWLKTLANDYPLSKVSIYSNNLFDRRLDFMKQQFPEIGVISVTKKKPYPDDLLRTLDEQALNAKQVLVIDDRVTSGILAAIDVQAKALLIKKPRMNFSRKTMKESFYFVVRKMERFLLFSFAKL